MADESFESSVESSPQPKKKSSRKSSSASTPARKVQVVPPRSSRKVSFDAWAKRRGVKEHHKGGLRAFVSQPDKLRTLQEWDREFENY